jgi:type II secretory pathway pseudopilin PulG
MIELLIVVAIIFIMSAISIPYVYSYRNKFKSEEQALKIMDLMREASQMALNQRRTIRFELDMTNNEALIIDENGAQPDTLLKSVPTEPAGVLRLDVNPAGVTRPNPPNYALAVFANDAVGHMDGTTPVINNRVWAIRFRSDGSVVNGGNITVSATLFVFPSTTPTSDVAADNRQIRAVTLYGGSGAVRYWKYTGTTFVPN